MGGEGAVGGGEVGEAVNCGVVVRYFAVLVVVVSSGLVGVYLAAFGIGGLSYEAPKKCLMEKTKI